MEQTIEDLMFDDCAPLQLFEEEFGFYGNNLRSQMKTAELLWLSGGAEGQPPIDEMVNSIIEQSLFSRYHEVCIGDTIYQIRPSGYRIVIPISEIAIMSNIRNALTIDQVGDIQIEHPAIEIEHDTNACYEAHYYKKGEQSHDCAGVQKSFIWVYKFDKALVGHRYRTSVTMTNYKIVNGQKRKDFAYCALGFQTRLYSKFFDSEVCTSAGTSSAALNTSSRYYSRLRLLYTLPVQTVNDTTFSVGVGPLEFYPQIEIEQYQMDPQESYAKCRHQGWTFTYDVSTGELQE